MAILHQFAKGLPAGLILAGALFVQGPAWADSEDTEVRPVAEFNRIDVQGAVDIYVSVGKEQKVSVSADRDYLSRIETRVSNQTLFVEQKGRHWHDADVELEISVKKLDGLVVEGAADGVVKGLNSDTFELRIDGAGDVTLEGTCGSATMEINGAGDITADNFKCKSVKITINGAGDADIYASESVEANLNGVGDITVHGNPSKVRPRIAGLGSFEVVDE
jgi:Putative auto-transporter adhesin, head GIN domain